MSKEWQYQVRIDLADEPAEVARRNAADPALAPLPEILERHRATMKSQYDAFAGYVAEAEREGIERYPLYHWTKATIENPAKQAKYQKSFTLYVDGDEVYAKDKADALEAELQPRRSAAPGHAPRQARHQSRQQPAAAGALSEVRLAAGNLASNGVLARPGQGFARTCEPPATSAQARSANRSRYSASSGTGASQQESDLGLADQVLDPPAVRGASLYLDPALVAEHDQDLHLRQRSVVGDLAPAVDLTRRWRQDLDHEDGLDHHPPSCRAARRSRPGRRSRCRHGRGSRSPPR